MNVSLRGAALIPDQPGKENRTAHCRAGWEPNRLACGGAGEERDRFQTRGGLLVPAKG